MFDKLLIANRGEIAVRVARTARRLGVRTIAVYSEADKDALHIRACDEAVSIGAAPAVDSYLNAEKILQVMRASGADAVHPGYGFLSENASFAAAVEAAGLVFVGPMPDTIRAMGFKSAAKQLMENAGVPVVPGYQGADQSLLKLSQEAQRIGFPVLLKASAGGGGKGMRLVESPDDIGTAMDSAKREAKSAFGDDRLLIEKYIPDARHVEVQIFGDGAGNVVHVFERDCSLQRRYQKVIEEAPAPNMPGDVRHKLLDAGVAAGRAVAYRGAGTVEFLYDGAKTFYFLEMNTRLQVEHPVSEAISGLDFVEWQLRIAAGQGLPFQQDEIKAQGHAIEARLYAEDPAQDFAPSVGLISCLKMPEDRVRIDAGVEEGQEISPYYDPMIAKLIASGVDRSATVRAMAGALRETRIAGLNTNAGFLHDLVSSELFRKGLVSTSFIKDNMTRLTASRPDEKVWAGAILWAQCRREIQSHDPWSALGGVRINGPETDVLWFAVDGLVFLVQVLRSARGYRAQLFADATAAARRDGRVPVADVAFAFDGQVREDGSVEVEVDGVSYRGFAARHKNGVRIWFGAQSWDMEMPDILSGVMSVHHTSEGSLAAPMPGVIIDLPVAPGSKVHAGTPVAVLEAMKMEHVLKAPADGVVRKFHFAPGDRVGQGDVLADFEEL